MFQTPGRVSFHDKNPRRAPQQISLGRMETMELPFPFPVLIIQPPPSEQNGKHCCTHFLSLSSLKARCHPSFVKTVAALESLLAQVPPAPHPIWTLVSNHLPQASCEQVTAPLRNLKKLLIASSPESPPRGV